MSTNTQRSGPEITDALNYISPYACSYKGKPGRHRHLKIVFDAPVWSELLDNLIPKEDLSSRCSHKKEPMPHCTLAEKVYDDVTFAEILDRIPLELLKPVVVRTGEVGYLEGGKCQTVYLKVPEEPIMDIFECVSDLHSSRYAYVPHISIAHVEPGKADKYVGRLEDMGYSEELVFFGNTLKYDLSSGRYIEYDLREGSMRVG